MVAAADQGTDIRGWQPGRQGQRSPRSASGRHRTRQETHPELLTLFPKHQDPNWGFLLEQDHGEMIPTQSTPERWDGSPPGTPQNSGGMDPPGAPQNGGDESPPGEPQNSGGDGSPWSTSRLWGMNSPTPTGKDCVKPAFMSKRLFFKLKLGEIRTKSKC